MTENLARRVKKKLEDRLALWADDGDHDDDEEECASNRLAVVLAEVQGRGADFRHLREVRLVDCLITDEKLAVLVASLGQGCVSVLALGGNQISNIGARTLGEALAALAPLRELHLNGNCIADPGVEALCKGLFGHLTAAEKKENLRKAKRLQRMASAKAKRLNVKGKSTSLTPPPVKKQQPPSRLAVLDLCSNPVSPEGARALAESLTLERCRLTTLRLGGVPKTLECFKPTEEGNRARKINQIVIGDAGAIMLCGALLLSPAVLEAKGHCGLETLCLSRCGIGQAGARALAAMLYCEPSLTSLDISGNVLEGKGVGRSFKERPLASRVLKRGLAEPPSAPLHDLDRQSGLACLGRALEATSSLKRVLHDNTDTASYFDACLRLDPPADWSRRRRLGVDACATREWLLSCFKAEGMALPSPGARETALAMENDMDEEPSPVLVEEKSSLSSGATTRRASQFFRHGSLLTDGSVDTVRTVATTQLGRVDEERLVYEPSSFHEKGEITEENWQKMKRREDREFRLSQGLSASPEKKKVSKRRTSYDQYRSTSSAHREPSQILSSLEPVSLQSSLIAFDYGDELFVEGEIDDSNAACAAWQSLDDACSDVWPLTYLESIAPSVNSEGDVLNVFHTLRSAEDDIPLGVLFPGCDVLAERSGVPSQARWDALWRCSTCLEVLGREREIRADASRAVLDASSRIVEKSIAVRLKRRSDFWQHQGAVDASVNAARDALRRREAVEAQCAKDLNEKKDALTALLQDCRTDRKNARDLAKSQAKSAKKAALESQKASTALRKAMKKAKADKEQKRAEGRETIHDEQAQARGETDARVLEALRVSDEASSYAKKTEDLRCRALERVTVAENCFQRTYLELLRLKADHAAASADVWDWRFVLMEFDRAETCRVIERCVDDAPYGDQQRADEAFHASCEEDAQRSEDATTRAFDLANRLKEASESRKEKQCYEENLQEGPCGSVAMDDAVVDARRKRDAADASLAAADAKRRLLVRLNPFASKQLAAELNAQVIAATQWRKACWQRCGDALNDASGFKASMRDGNLTPRRKAQNDLGVTAKHPSSETLVTAYNAVTVRAVRAIEFEKKEEKRVKDEALRLREEQRRDRNEQLAKLAKVDPRQAGHMIVARIRAMRDGGLPADKDDLDDLRALRQSKARAKGRLRAKQTRRLFKKAKALRDDAFEASEVAKHALQALMDAKERKRVDELLRLEELGLSPPKPKVRKKSKSLWRRVFGSRKVILDRPLRDEPQCPTQRRLRDKVRTKGLAPLPAIAKIIKDDFSTNANHIVLKPKKKRFTPGLPLDYKEAICYDSDESSEGDLFDDLEVLGEEG